jgi:hypothetical protein
MAGRDLVQDETPGLNCACYTNMVMTLTQDKASAGTGAR